MGYDFTSDERYQSDHGGSPVIDAMAKRIAEIEAAAHDVSAILHVLSTWVISEDVLAEIEKARRRLMNAG